MDASRPTRFIQQECNGDTVFSRFDSANPVDPLPVEVKSLHGYGQGRPQSKVRFLRRSLRYNVPIDSEVFTLAGLDMPVGTEVVDSRIHRRIGYWTGSGLSEKRPATQPATPAGQKGLPLDPGKLLRLAQRDSKSSFALEAAIWTMLNTPDGPGVEQASEMIQREHIAVTNARISLDLMRVNHA
jgi:hypothetical protein